MEETPQLKVTTTSINDVYTYIKDLYRFVLMLVVSSIAFLQQNFKLVQYNTLPQGDATMMVQCPKCGQELATPQKEIDNCVFHVAVFACEHCGNNFKVCH